MPTLLTVPSSRAKATGARRASRDRGADCCLLHAVKTTWLDVSSSDEAYHVCSKEVFEIKKPVKIRWETKGLTNEKIDVEKIV